MDIIIRPLTLADEPFLWEMLYQAIYVPEGSSRPKREILSHPNIAKYVKGWEKPDDYGFIAIDPITAHPVGAAWFRLFSRGNRGYGYVDDATPELTIAVLPEYRGKGIGNRLLTKLLEYARLHYVSISLSVIEENPALRLYQRLGFQEFKRQDGAALTMLKRFKT